MKPIFRCAVTNSNEERNALLENGTRILISYVFDTDPGEGFDRLPPPDPGELYFMFDVAQHSGSGRRFLLEAPQLGPQGGALKLWTVPHWKSFVVGIGPFVHAFTVEEASDMVWQARREVAILEKSFGRDVWK